VAGALRGEFTPDPFAGVARKFSRNVTERLSYIGEITRAGLPGFLKHVDVLLFPSTASRETLGRVSLEVAAHGCSVLSTDHAAGYELFQKDLCSPVVYDHGSDFSFSGNERLGEIALGPWVQILESESVPYTPLLELDRFSWVSFDRVLEEVTQATDVRRPLHPLPSRVVTDFGVMREEGDLATATFAFLSYHFPEEAKRWFPGMKVRAGRDERKPFYDYTGFANNMEDFVSLPKSFEISTEEG
jgi:hypothetical protein